MTHVASATASPALYGSIQPLVEWHAVLLEGLLEAQRIQFEIVTAWQRPITAVNQELWNRWLGRFAGGVPNG